jgi:hypothetical protein
MTRLQRPPCLLSIAGMFAWLVCASSAALAHTPTPTPVPTNTDGPSPTITQTGTITPDPTATATGTYPIPPVYLDVSPNPARSGQRVTLDASRNNPSATYRWSQIGGDPTLQIDDADRPIAHFTVPPVDDVTLVTMQVSVSGLNSGPATATIMLLPSDAVTAYLAGGASAPPGSTVPVDVTLRSYGVAVTALEHEIGFGPYAPVADRGGGVPDCAPAPGLVQPSASFTFVPDGCVATDTCTGVHASLTAQAPIAEEGTVYSCNVLLVEKPSPPEEGCVHWLTCTPGTATARSGAALRVLCPDGSDTDVIADYALRPLAFSFRAEPAVPNVGDAVRVTFSVRGDGGLPGYQLYGVEPILHGTTTALPGGPLGDVSFDLQADCPGMAPLSLRVNYETTSGCPGNTYFRFTGAWSPVFDLLVREPGSYRITGRVAKYPQACAGAQVGVRLRLDPPGWFAWADDAGAFAFDGVPPGDYTVVTADGCGAFQCWPQQAVELVDQDVDVSVCPQRLAGDACVGDCDLGGSVDIDELILGVSMALGSQPFAACPAIDADGDGAITVDEVIRAVSDSLQGCADAEPAGGRQ